MSSIDELTAHVDAARAARRKLPHLEESRRVAADRVAGLEERLDAEQGDVARLEGMSLARVVASIRGRRVDQLSRERAEADAALLSVTAAKQQLGLIEAQVRECAALASGLAIAERRLSEAADAAMSALDPSDARTPALAALAERRTAANTRLKEAKEAAMATSRALEGLRLVADDLASAGTWSTYDTFFGGGLVSTMVKHSRLDDAADHAASAQDALRRLSTELHDVRLPADIPLPQITAGQRTFDGWFDNIFTDYSVHSQIRSGQDNIAGVTRAVESVAVTLRQVIAAAEAELAAVEDERRRLASGL